MCVLRKYRSYGCGFGLELSVNSLEMYLDELLINMLFMPNGEFNCQHFYVHNLSFDWLVVIIRRGWHCAEANR